MGIMQRGQKCQGAQDSESEEALLLAQELSFSGPPT